MKNMDTDNLRQSAEQIHLTEEQKIRIVENCMKHAGKSPDTGTVTETRHVFEVERVKSHPIRRVIAGLAACAVVAAGIGFSVSLISRSGVPVGVSDPGTETSEPVSYEVPFGDISAYNFLGDLDGKYPMPEGGKPFSEKQAEQLNRFFRSQPWDLIHTYNTGDEGFDPNFDGSLLGEGIPMIDEYCYRFRSQDENGWHGDIEFGTERYLEYRRPDTEKNSEIVEIYAIDPVSFRDAVDAVLEGREIPVPTEPETMGELKLIQVLDVVGMNCETAKDQLEQRGFTVRIAYVAGKDKDYVISADKEAGANYPAGTEIILYVANGSDTEEDHGYPFPAFTDHHYLESQCFYDYPDAEKSAALDELFRSLTWTIREYREYRTDEEFEEALNSSFWDDPNSIAIGDVVTYSFKTENKVLGTTLVNISPNGSGCVVVADKDCIRIYDTDFDKLAEGIGQILFGEGLYGEDAPFGNYSGQEIGCYAGKFAVHSLSTSDPAAQDTAAILQSFYWQKAPEGYTGTDEHLGFGEFDMSYRIDDTVYSLVVYDNDYAVWNVSHMINDTDSDDIQSTAFRVDSDNLMHCFCLMTGAEVYPPFGSLDKMGSTTVNGSIEIIDYDRLHRLTQLFYGYNWNSREAEPGEDETPEFEFTCRVNDTTRHILVYADGRVAWFDGSSDRRRDSGCIRTALPEEADICTQLHEILG